MASVLPICLTQAVLHPAHADRALIDGVNMTLQGQSKTIIMGPNGAGKSLLIRVIQGLIPLTRGEIYWHDGVRKPPPRSIALVSQKPVLFRRSVEDNLRHALTIYGVPRNEQATQVELLMEKGGLMPMRHTPARCLSGGEQQRLSLIRALAADPQVLLLDEPTASLDPPSTYAIEELVLEAADHGIKIVMVTHNRGQAKRLADDIFFMCQGRIIEHQPMRAFFDNPQSQLVQTYLAGRLVL